MKSSNFITNVLKISIGTAIAQGLGILVAPIITRLFAPEAFGLAALFTSITGTIGVIACLRYELSIMLPKSDEEAANLLGISLCFVLIITGMSLIIVFFAKENICGLLKVPGLAKYLWLLPIMVLVNGVFLALNYWNSRTKHFGRLAIVRVVSSATSQAVKLVAGFAGYVSGGILISATLLGSLVSVTVLCSKIWRNDGRLFRDSIRWKKMIAEMKRHKNFPIFSTWSILLNSASVQLPIWILAFFFSPRVVGFYALSRMVLGIPLKLVGNAVSQVFYQKAAEVNNSYNGLPKVVENVCKRLISIGLFPALLMMFIGKDVFEVIFGTTWSEAGVYTQILSPWLFCALIASVVNKLFNVLERQDAFLIFNIILCLTRAIILTVGGLIGEPRLVMLFFSGTSLVIIIYMCFWVFSRVGVPLAQIIRQIGKYAAYSSPMLAIVALTKWGFALEPLGILVVGCLVVIPYYCIILKQDKELQKIIQPLFLKTCGFLKQAKVLSLFLSDNSKIMINKKEKEKEI